MILGVTATRRGLTGAQKVFLKTFLMDHDVRWLLHGDCKGGDSDAHDLAMELNIPIHSYPGLLTKWRAMRLATIKEPPEEELKRNRKIVDACDMLIGFPEGDTERRRGSGTWAAIRYAKKTQKPLVIVYPSGRIEA